ncbi:hypothetical protein ACRQ5I_05165 [Pseudoramibacter alactolyticus]|uniref:hypothetical protein n=1 Tax=Pseudoramibacter alactolyticus TaxID=113287 RepID=UPI00145D05DC|nr:hypothetical protein [Pseudoramibacter alactolyticus]
MAKFKNALRMFSRVFFGTLFNSSLQLNDLLKYNADRAIEQVKKLYTLSSYLGCSTSPKMI